MKMRILAILLAFIPAITFGQTINISLAKEANKDFVFILHKGYDSDTIKTSKLNFAGGTTLTIPPSYKGYKGMAKLVVGNGNPISIVVNNESFDMSIDANGTTTFRNSPENEYLFAIMQGRTAPDPTSKLYAHKYLEIMQYVQQISKVLFGQPSLAEKAEVKIYALNKMDTEALYTSGLWVYVVDGLTKMSNSEQAVATDMIKLLKRIKSQAVFEHLVDNLITITMQYGWNDAFDSILGYVKDSGRIPVPQGSIYDAFKALQVRVGHPSPPIVGLTKNSNYKKILLVFYQPDCNVCEPQMEELIRRHKELETKGIRIVSISSDHNKAQYEKDVTHYPWKDKLCDFKGFAGPNFVEWGILGTPSYYLLDNNQIVLGKYVLLKDIPL